MSDKNLMMRNDTLLGVCKGLGEDFGFNPTYLRVALILPLFWFPLQMVVIYLGLGVVVFASRMLFSDKSEQASAELKLAHENAALEQPVPSDEAPLRNAA